MLYMGTVYSFIPCCLIGVADNSEREEGFHRPPSSSSEDSEEDEDLDGSVENLNNIISKLKTAGKGFVCKWPTQSSQKKKNSSTFFWQAALTLCLPETTIFLFRSFLSWDLKPRLL